MILQVHTLNPRQLEMLALLDEIKKHGGEAKAGVSTATKKALVFPDSGEEILFLFLVVFCKLIYRRGLMARNALINKSTGVIATKRGNG